MCTGMYACMWIVISLILSSSSSEEKANWVKVGIFVVYHGALSLMNSQFNTIIIYVCMYVHILVTVRLSCFG